MQVCLLLVLIMMKHHADEFCFDLLDLLSIRVGVTVLLQGFTMFCDSNRVSEWKLEYGS